MSEVVFLYVFSVCALQIIVHKYSSLSSVIVLSDQLYLCEDYHHYVTVGRAQTDRVSIVVVKSNVETSHMGKLK